MEHSLISTCRIHSSIVDNNPLSAHMLIDKLSDIVHSTVYDDPIPISKGVVQDDAGNSVGLPFLRMTTVGSEDVLHVATPGDQAPDDVLYLRLRLTTKATNDSFERIHN